MVKFNMGCGLNKKPGYTNVDASPVCAPDEVFDLETTPWPWPDGCAEEVVFNHSLEHMGAQASVFLGIMRELYRICAPDARVAINAPHPRHDNFINDPTHVRIITPELLVLFDQAQNEIWRQTHAANSPLGLYTGVDFVVESRRAVLAEPYLTQLNRGEATEEQLAQAMRSLNNVVSEWRIVLRARKPAASTLGA